MIYRPMLEGLLVTSGPSGSEFSSGNVKDHRAYIRIRWNNHQRRKGHLYPEVSTRLVVALGGQALSCLPS